MSGPLAALGDPLGVPTPYSDAKSPKRAPWPPILAVAETQGSKGHGTWMTVVGARPRWAWRGMRNFDNYRLRLLLHSGVQWDTRPNARIRDRQPRLIA